jgi:SMODS-associating 2TM, beta-strand rich effector domain
MLHLLPIRLVFQGVATLAGIAMVAAVYAGAVGTGDAFKDMTTVVRWSSTIAAVSIALLYASWRWIPPLQRLIFPYLGGRWSGVLNFTYRGKPGQRDVQMEIKHTLFGLRLLTDTEESSSSTIAVHADKNPDFERYRLYYVYVNERKEGVSGAGATYRGLAVLRVEWSAKPELRGDYFTESRSAGTLHLKRDKSHPWWKLWQ